MLWLIPALRIYFMHASQNLLKLYYSSETNEANKQTIVDESQKYESK